MHRRTFVKGAMSSLLVPTAVSVTQAGVMHGDYIFFDERFPAARRLAGDLTGAAIVMPVRGDITPVWHAGLDRACRQSPLTLHGVTTESFYFCLGVMLQGHTRPTSRAIRISRDLFRWTIHSDNKPLTG